MTILDIFNYSFEDHLSRHDAIDGLIKRGQLGECRREHKQGEIGMEDDTLDGMEKWVNEEYFVIDFELDVMVETVPRPTGEMLLEQVPAN